MPNDTMPAGVNALILPHLDVGRREHRTVSPGTTIAEMAASGLPGLSADDRALVRMAIARSGRERDIRGGEPHQRASQTARRERRPRRSAHHTVIEEMVAAAVGRPGSPARGALAAGRALTRL